jgi:metal-sulfur cluster biosynthetic enzyme
MHAAISGHRAITAGRYPSGGLGRLEVAYAVNAAWNALTYVCDPELCLDVVLLGLICDVRAEQGAIVVELRGGGGRARCVGSAVESRDDRRDRGGRRRPADQVSVTRRPGPRRPTADSRCRSRGSCHTFGIRR